MNKNIYLKELKRNWKSSIAWTIALSALITFFMSFYPILMESNILNQANDIFRHPYFQNIMAAFGMSMDNLTNIFGFYVSYSGLYIILLGCIFSILLASNILSKEESQKTADFLLSKPVTRNEILFSKFLAYLTYLIILNIGIALSAYISLEIHKTAEFSIMSFLVLSLYFFLLMLTFGCLGIFISLLIKRGRQINGITIGVVVGTYFFNAFSRLGEAVDFIGYVSPFKYIDTNVLSPDYSLDGMRLLFFLGISTIALTLSWLVYKRKDILL